MMNKSSVLKIIAFVLMLMLGVAILPAAAQDSSAPFAEYFPADSALYAYIRTDDAYIDQLDGLLARVSAALPAEANIPAGLTLRSGLDMIAAQLGGDFDSVFRSWLGDGIAVGVSPAMMGANSGDGEGLIAVSITDRSALLSLIGEIMARGGGSLTPTEINGYTVFDLDNSSSIAVGDNVAFVAPRRDLLPLESLPENSLAGNAAFNESLDQLPAESYNILLYADLSTIQASQLANGEIAVSEIVPGIGATAVGATILDSTTLTIDVAQSVDTSVIMEGLNIPAVGAVDPAFLAHVPADATLVIQGTNLKALYDAFIASVPTLTAQDFDPTTEEEIQLGLAQVDTLFQSFVGVTLQDGVLSWLTGDYALFLTYQVPEPGTPTLFTSSLFPDQPVTTLSFEAGLVIKATDPAKAQALVDGIGNALTQFGANAGVTVAREEIAGTNAVVITTPAVAPAPAVELVLAANDSVFVFGTRQAATAALQGDGGLSGAARYVASTDSILLPGATTVWYADANTINLFGDALAASGPSINGIFNNIVGGMDAQATPIPFDFAAAQAQAAQAQQMFRQLAGAFSGATISTGTSANGSVLIRMTLTLAE